MDKKEKKVKKENKEQVKKTEPKEKQNKVNLDKKKKLLILILAIVLVAVIGITIFFVLRNDDEYKLADVEPTISTLEDGTYYMFGSPNNQSFEVETKEDFTYKVVDEENNEVKVSTTKKDNKVVINAPENLYEDGKTYTLTITNGTFIEEDLKEATTVSFSIVRKSKQTSELNKDVKAVSSETNQVSETDDKIILTSETEYKTGDIILIDNEKAYKVEKSENGTYQLSIPTIEEVYKELDYYGVQVLDLTDFETDENFKEYLEDNIEESLLNKIIPEVDAASKIELELKYDKKKEELIAIVKIATSPGDKLFNNKFLDNHEFSTTFEIGIKMLLYRDITLYKQDVGLTLNLRTDIGTQVSHPMFRKFKETFEEEFNNDKLIDVRDYVKDAKKDNVKAENDIGKMSVPTGITGLNVIFNMGYLFNFDLKTDLNAGLENKLDVVIGYSSKKGLYGNTDTNSKATSSFVGEGEFKIGFQGEAGVSILNIIDLVGVIEVGGYNKGSLSIANTVSEETKTIITTTGEAGLFATVKAEADTPIGDLTYTVVDKKFKLIDINESIDAKTILKAQDKPVSKEEDTTQKAETNNNSNNNTNNNNNNNSNNNPEDSNDEEYEDEPADFDMANYTPKLVVDRIGFVGVHAMWDDDNLPNGTYFNIKAVGAGKTITINDIMTWRANIPDMKMDTDYTITLQAYIETNGTKIYSKEISKQIHTRSSSSSVSSTYTNELANYINTQRVNAGKTELLRDNGMDIAATICAEKINYNNISNAYGGECIVAAGYAAGGTIFASRYAYGPTSLSATEFYNGSSRNQILTSSYVRMGVGYHDGLVVVLLATLDSDYYQ